MGSRQLKTTSAGKKVSAHDVAADIHSSVITRYPPRWTPGPTAAELRPATSALIRWGHTVGVGV